MAVHSTWFQHFLFRNSLSLESKETANEIVIMEPCDVDEVFEKCKESIKERELKDAIVYLQKNLGHDTFINVQV